MDVSCTYATRGGVRARWGWGRGWERGGGGEGMGKGEGEGEFRDHLNYAILFSYALSVLPI